MGCEAGAGPDSCFTNTHGLLCGSFRRKGEVFAHVGLIQNLKDSTGRVCTCATHEDVTREQERDTTLRALRPVSGVGSQTLHSPGEVFAGQGQRQRRERKGKRERERERERTRERDEADSQGDRLITGAVFAGHVAALPFVLSLSLLSLSLHVYIEREKDRYG